MPRPPILALVMAGGAGSRLDVLTEQRAKPAMPYGGVYRLVDFPLSNCMHSRIPDVWIVQQYQPHSLNDHVSNGRPWDLDRTHGGLRTLQPHQGGEEAGWHRGNADAIFRNRSFIEESGADTLVVLSSDHVYKLDYREAVARHRERGARVTMVTTKVSTQEATRFGNLLVGDDDRVTAFAYKPEDPISDVVMTEVFVFDSAHLLATLKELNEDDEGGGDGERLEDLGDALLPRMVDEGDAYEYRLAGYWRDLGLIESYWASHMDLLVDDPELQLDDPAWPILTHGGQRPPARVEGSARLDKALLSPGCRIRGTVERSVLSPGVVVEEGAVVRDSVILHEAFVDRGARVDCSILDMEVEVGGDARVGAPRPRSDVGADDVAVVGRGARVGPRTSAGPGARVEPGSGAGRRDPG
jgi:glucose-1-phosphate adenylyltransferase